MTDYIFVYNLAVTLKCSVLENLHFIQFRMHITFSAVSYLITTETI